MRGAAADPRRTAKDRVLEAEAEASRQCPDIPYGTAIATFVNGVYPNWTHGNHAAIFGGRWSGHHKGKLASGILIFDQWKGKENGPNWRLVFYGDGVSDRSNDGAAFSVILTAKPMWPTGTRIPVRH